jgi:hypothetical protein
MLRPRKEQIRAGGVWIRQSRDRERRRPWPPAKVRAQTAARREREGGRKKDGEAQLSPSLPSVGSPASSSGGGQTGGGTGEGPTTAVVKCRPSHP